MTTSSFSPRMRVSLVDLAGAVATALEDDAAPVGRPYRADAPPVCVVLDEETTVVAVGVHQDEVETLREFGRFCSAPLNCERSIG